MSTLSPIRPCFPPARQDGDETCSCCGRRLFPRLARPVDMDREALLDVMAVA